MIINEPYWRLRSLLLLEYTKKFGILLLFILTTNKYIIVNVYMHIKRKKDKHNNGLEEQKYVLKSNYNDIDI